MEDNLIQQNQSDKRTISFVSLIILVLLLLVVGFFSWLWYVHAEMHKPLSENSASTIFFTVTKGDSVNEIGKHLVENGIIKSDFIFRLYTWEKNLHRLQAGKYALNAHMTPAEIADMIENGKIYYDYVKITIPEGFTMSDIQTRLNESPLWEKSEKNLYDYKAGDFSEKYDFLRDISANSILEGYLFPDTYQFERGVSSEFIIQKMLDNFNEKLSPALREEAINQNKSIYDIITMASIIEKEVRTEEDMKLVSGILWKRMAIGMPLETDATVSYVVGKQTLSLNDLKVNSPYNTYKYKGLPKGPISNPGLHAIQAALYPVNSDYLFYLSKPDGVTVFSRTFQEHSKAKATYLK